MNITETDKTKIASLINIAIDQIQYVNSLTIQLGDDFDVEPFVPFLLDSFPLAVDPLLIADPNSEEDKISRAYGILSILITDPIKEKFLDFGCGEGHSIEVVKGVKKAVGYDLVTKGWDRLTLTPNKILTSSWEEVVNNGPYDTILIYDVLDHMKSEEEVVDELKKIRLVLGEIGKIYIRCHPWCSRHGTHLYQMINRAYLHLCLNEHALDELGYRYIKTLKIIHPLQTYEKWFKLAGLSILKQNIVSEKVEPFFHQSSVASLIKKHWKNSHEEPFSSGRQFPEWQMGQSFVDFQLQA